MITDTTRDAIKAINDEDCKKYLLSLTASVTSKVEGEDLIMANATATLLANSITEIEKR